MMDSLFQLFSFVSIIQNKGKEIFTKKIWQIEMLYVFLHKISRII